MGADFNAVFGDPNVGPRTVTISGGGTLNAAVENWAVVAIGWTAGDTESIMTVTGEGSKLVTSAVGSQAEGVGWATIGYEDGTTGVLFIQDGGALEAGADIAVGHGVNSTARIDVDAGFLETKGNAQLRVAYERGSRGEVNLSNGSTATLGGNVLMGRNTGATAAFNILSGSEATSNGRVVVGETDGSNATFTVDGEGSTYISNGAFDLGYASGATGKLVVGNRAEATFNDDLRVGLMGNGAIEVNTGGKVTANTDVHIGGTEGERKGGKGSLIIDGAGSSFTVNDKGLFIGFSTPGTESNPSGSVTVSNGGTLTLKAEATEPPGNVTVIPDSTERAGNLTLGYGDGTYGSLDVKGAGSSVAVGGDLYAGAFSTRVSDDASFVVDGKTYMGTDGGVLGYFNVSGGDVTLNDETYIGDGGTVIMAIDQGGTVSANSAVFLGRANGTGRISVKGDESKLNMSGSRLAVGYEGIGEQQSTNGQVYILEGGAVSVGELMIGELSGSIGQISVSGTGINGNNEQIASRLDVTGNATIGGAGTGYLQVDTGAVADIGGSLILGDTGSGTVYVRSSDIMTRLDVDEEVVVAAGAQSQGTLDLYYSSAMSVGGDFTVAKGDESEGAVSLGSSNSSIDIGGGLAIGVNDGSNGTVRVFGGATVSVGTEDGEGNYDGTISVAQNSGSTGTLIIGGDRTAGGDYDRARAGRVNAGTLTFGDGNGSLVFSVTDTDYTFGLDVSGGGAIEAYNGTVSLTGDYSEYDGDTNIHGGTLSVDTGTFTHSAIKVMGGATLAGSGTVSDVTLQDGSTVAPGGAGISTLTVSGGDLSFADGASYAVTVSSDGSSDLLAVKSTEEDEAPGIAVNNIGGAGGTVTLGGSSSLSVSRLASDTAGDFKVNTWYTILTADQGISGEFSEVSDDFAYLDTSVDYDDDTKVLLALTRNDTDFEDVVGSSNTNARNAARAVGSMDEENPLYEKVLFLEEGDVDRTYQALSGETHAGMAGALVQSTAPTRRLVVNRMRQLTPGAGAAPAAVTRNATSYGAEAGSFFRDPEVWGQAYGSWSKLDGSDGASGMESTTGGVVIGADAETDGGWRTGVFGSFGMVDTDARDGSADSDADSYQLGVYTARSFGQMALRMGASYSWDDVSADRTVTVGGVRQDLEADYWARTAQAFVELGYQTWAGSTSLEPFIGQAILYQEIDSFTETGGSAALSVDGEDLTQGITTVGLRFGRDLEGLGAGMSNLHGAVAWQHVTGDLNAESTMRFASGGDAFSVTGSALDRNQAVLSLGLRTELTERSVLDIGYEGTLSENSQSHGLQATYSIRF
ncbi:autotransporter domain-containing protein [Rhodovulum sulfidophilum]|nr:autotransporter domain-containing protein [Rhodovulum sulfidophilum]OLS42637.1 hypothetical protein BV379_19760 [Rhodovulum sulfidophilum]